MLSSIQIVTDLVAPRLSSTIHVRKRHANTTAMAHIRTKSSWGESVDGESVLRTQLCVIAVVVGDPTTKSR
jgi:hypothetical protein